MSKIITEPEQLRLLVDPPKVDLSIKPEESAEYVAIGVFNPTGLKKLTIERKLPAFLATQELREVYSAAVAYWQGTQDRTLMDLLRQAVAFAEGVEDPTSFDECLSCGERIPKSNSYCKKSYCSLDCAETDGAIEK